MQQLAARSQISGGTVEFETLRCHGAEFLRRFFEFGCADSAVMIRLDDQQDLLQAKKIRAVRCCDSEIGHRVLVRCLFHG